MNRTDLKEFARTLEPILDGAFMTNYNLIQRQMWLDKFRQTVPSPHMNVTFPINDHIATSRVTEIGVEPVFERITLRSFDMKVRQMLATGIKIHHTELDGVYSKRAVMESVQAMAGELARKHQQIAQGILKTGETTAQLAYDGEPVFSTTHKVGKYDRTWSNLLTYTLPAAPEDRPAAIQEAINAVRVQFAKIPVGKAGTEEEYLPSEGMEFHVMCSASRYLDFKRALGIDQYQDGISALNPVAGMVSSLISNAELETSGDTDSFYIFMKKAGITSTFITLDYTGAGTQGVFSSAADWQHEKLQDSVAWFARKYGMTYIGQFFTVIKVKNDASS
jgi:hypothetical protein